jgi:hypothetical protein
MLLARIALQITTALEEIGDRDSEELSEIVGSLRRRLEEGDKQTVEVLRAELGEHDRT